MTPHDPTALQTSLVATVRRMRGVLVGGTIVLAVIELVATALVPSRPWTAVAVAILTSAILAVASWWIVQRALRGIDILVLWVGGGYIVKLVLVAGAVLGARAVGFDEVWTGAWLIAEIILCAVTEVVMLARTRLTSVDPRVQDSPGK